MGSQISVKALKFFFQLWMSRNNHLHDTAAVDTNSGKDQLRIALIQEYDIGIKDLPHIYKSYFSSLSKSLYKQVKYQKNGF